MDFASTFKTDHDAEINGVWVPLDKDTKLLIARMGNERNRELFLMMSSELEIAMSKKTIGNEYADDLLIRIMAKSILLDWKGVEDEGQEVPYSEENAIKLLKKYKDFRDLVTAASQSMELYKVKKVELQGKN